MERAGEEAVVHAVSGGRRRNMGQLLNAIEKPLDLTQSGNFVGSAHGGPGLVLELRYPVGRKLNLSASSSALLAGIAIPSAASFGDAGAQAA